MSKTGFLWGFKTKKITISDISRVKSSDTTVDDTGEVVDVRDTTHDSETHDSDVTIAQTSHAHQTNQSAQTKQSAQSDASATPPSSPSLSATHTGSATHTRFPLRARLIIGDGVAAALAFALPSFLDGSLAALQIDEGTTRNFTKLLFALFLGVSITFVGLGMERLYQTRVVSMRTVEISKITQLSVGLVVVAVFFAKALGEPHLARYPALVGIFACIFLNLWRAIFASWLREERRADRFTRDILLVGANDDAARIFRLLRTHPELGYRVGGIVGRRDDFAEHDFSGAHFLGELNELPDIMKNTDFSGAMLTATAYSRAISNSTLRELLDNYQHVQMSTGITGIDQRRMRGQSLAYEPIMYVEQSTLDSFQLGVKRLLDVVIASIVLLAVSPILLVSALIIRRDGGPVLYKNLRIGKDERPFDMLKLRSMVVDADAHLAQLQADNLREGPLFKLSDDPRVTRFGKFIRATSIDELPQLFNVLRGDMSLVGPRPALPHEVAQFDDAHLVRHNVLPGITGLWQVEGRDNSDFWLYQRFDIFYVENWSVLLDLSILLGTARVVMARGLAFLRRKHHSVMD